MDRRAFLRLSSMLAGSRLSGLEGIVHSRRAPAMIARVLRDADAPAVVGGVQCGDVTSTRAVIWSATDRAARMVVELSVDETFRTSRRIQGPAALEKTNFTAKLDVGGLTPGEPVFYRVWFEDLSTGGLRSAPATGQFRAASRSARPFTICWSGDVVGQGWGINEAFGGLRLYETMARHHPDLFIHSGDQIYADGPLQEQVALPGGAIWKNIVTDAKRHVAQSLDDFRGNFAYNLLDAHARQFNSQVPMIVQWDDHEVRNNWNPGTDLAGDARYGERNIALLASRARRAMFEYLPIRNAPAEPGRVYRAYDYGPLVDVIVLDQRSYRTANGWNREQAGGPPTRMLGANQLAWLKRRLKASRATWKIVASDMPLGLLVGDGRRDGQPVFDGWANGDGGPLGRERELADLLAFLERERIRNHVWVTADVHYAAAHRYDPAAAVFKRFDPFWEFVAGPLNAGTFGPALADPTFGCTQVFNSVEKGGPQNLPPSDGFQFFGTLTVDPSTRRLAVGLWNLANERLWSIELDAEAA